MTREPRTRDVAKLRCVRKSAFLGSAGLSSVSYAKTGGQFVKVWCVMQ